MSLDKNLTRLRKEHGLSQEKLAEIMGLSRQAISKWEAGLSYPDISNLQELSQIYGITLDELLNEDLSDIHIDLKLGEKRCPECQSVCDEKDGFCCVCGYEYETIKQSEKCPQCQSLRQDDDQYCCECGYEFIDEDKVFPVKNDTQSNRIKIGIACGVLVLSLVLLVAFLQPSQETPPSHEPTLDVEEDYQQDSSVSEEEHEGPLDSSSIQESGSNQENNNANSQTGGQTNNEVSNNDEVTPPPSQKQPEVTTPPSNVLEDIDKKHAEAAAKEAKLIKQDYEYFTKIVDYMESNVDNPPANFYNIVTEKYSSVPWASIHGTEMKQDIFMLNQKIYDAEGLRKASDQVKTKWNKVIAAL